MRHVSVLVLACVATGLALAKSWVLHRFGGTTVGTGAVLRGLLGFHSGVALFLLQPFAPTRVASRVALAASASIILGICAGSPVAVVLAGAATIAALASSEHGLAARALSWAPLVWLGRVSFSIYMLHSQLQVVLNRALSPLMNRWSMLAVFLAILFPLSEATYRFIEQPGRRLPAFIIAKIRSVDGRYLWINHK